MADSGGGLTVEDVERVPLGPQLRPGDLHARLQALHNLQRNVGAQLEAVTAIGGQLDLEVVLRQIIDEAVSLTDARYGALGVTGETGQLAEFLPVGLDTAQVAQIANWPAGRGPLGQLMRRQGALRLADLSAYVDRAGFPDGHPPMRSFLGAPIRIRDEVCGSLYLTDKRDERQFDASDEALVIALAAAAGVAVDNARLHAEASRQQDWVRANAAVTQRLLSDDEPMDVLAMVAQQALEMSGADLVCISLPAGSRDLMVVEYAAGLGAAEALGLAAPTDRTAAGIVMASGRPLAVDNFTTDERIAAVARQRLSLGPAVMVPLGPAGEVRGVLTAGRHCGSPPLPAAAVDMVATFAAQAGIGVELAKRRQDAHRIALFADRDRIARDLHDLVIQRLFATGMSLQGAASLIVGAEAADRVRHAVDDLDETISDIRAAIFTLRSRGEPDLPSLQARIVTLAEEMTGAVGFPPWLRMDGRLDSRVPGEVAEEMLAALREALSNVARHSGASQVDVTVETCSDLVLTVRDNGVGMSQAGHRSGLANLAERAGRLGGTLRVTVADGGGTELSWRVPLPDAGEPGD